MSRSACFLAFIGVVTLSLAGCDQSNEGVVTPKSEIDQYLEDNPDAQEAADKMFQAPGGAAKDKS
ncbi:hypothetical protein [Rubripirellula obstinata]|nr:hypothetical protein [Rubripirellula obstinata]